MDYEKTLQIMDDTNEMLYGVRPFGTKREEKIPTPQEQVISDMVGLPVKIK